jgi:predicted phage gp36 major capsid-like protein
MCCEGQLSAQLTVRNSFGRPSPEDAALLQRVKDLAASCEEAEEEARRRRAALRTALHACLSRVDDIRAELLHEVEERKAEVDADRAALEAEKAFMASRAGSEVSGEDIVEINVGGTTMATKR